MKVSPARSRIVSPGCAASMAGWRFVYMHPLAQTVRVAPCAEAAKRIVAESVHTASRKRCTSRSPVSRISGNYARVSVRRGFRAQEPAGKTSATDRGVYLLSVSRCYSGELSVALQNTTEQFCNNYAERRGITLNEQPQSRHDHGFRAEKETWWCAMTANGRLASTPDRYAQPGML